MSDKTPTEFGQRLRKLREIAGLSTKQLDKLADLSEGHVSTLENRDKDNVSARVVLLLADTIGCTMDFLYAGRGRQPPANDILAAVKRRQARPLPPRQRQVKGAAVVVKRANGR
jgi:transcriptional regulator with XRE-family HTH domain